MDGITFISDFLPESSRLFNHLAHSVHWDERMFARKTASFGVAYNYSQISYPYQEFTPELTAIIDAIAAELGFRPNNCLINYYLDGSSKMGWHSDQTDILAPGTGVVIVSLGATRSLRFREIAHKENKVDFPLPSGSLIYMTQQVQALWQHAVPKADTDQGRMSLTFREIVVS